ncbi:APE4 (YHR113W) [Zygosaccharomyces parabailii]|nr:APE4 (YHR113W) [Zygosaccharomyces parabailii]CDH14181.1 probable Aspartyl aminopeptidase 4 [Zygosaccharomyces bailii ISA1307]
MFRVPFRRFSTMSNATSSVDNYPQEFINFLNSSHSPYHAVQSIKLHLEGHGFQELNERDAWYGKVERQGKYYVTRNNSSIVAFSVGGRWKPGNPIALTGAHTDSPVLRIKPVSKRKTENYEQIGVECYGGGIWHSWFDSDLSIAGRVFVKDKPSGKVVSKLVDLNKPLLKIPTLAIHLDREVNTKFQFDKESQLLPICGLSKDESKQEEQGSFSSLKAAIERHHRSILDLVAKQLSLESVNDIEDFELLLYDYAAATLGGVHDEFVFSGRLDNLTSCFTSMHALTLAAETNLAEEVGIRLMACFDHEEIGSASAQGADSNFLPNVIERLATLKGDSTDVSEPLQKSYILETFAKSFFMSSDVAHAVHPNYLNKYESQHKPIIGNGPVVKINANQRYMTNSPGIVLVKQLADKVKVPLQLFVAANTSPCGSTIGPILASKTGIRTLDLGNPILSMHSIRETGGSADLGLQIKLFREFFEQYSTIESNIIV